MDGSLLRGELVCAPTAAPAAGPRPTTFDLGLEREAQEGSDRDYRRQQTHALDGQRRGDGVDDVGADQQLKTEKDPAPEIGAICLVGPDPVTRPHAADQEVSGRKGHPRNHGEHAKHFQHRRDVAEEGMKSLEQSPRLRVPEPTAALASTFPSAIVNRERAAIGPRSARRIAQAIENEQAGRVEPQHQRTVVSHPQHCPVPALDKPDDEHGAE